MAVSRAELETMDRDELIETVAQLSQRVEDLEAKVTGIDDKATTQQTINHLMAALTGASPEDFTIDPMRLRDDAQSFHDRVVETESQVASIRNVGGDQTSKEEKIAQVVAYAHNEKSQSQSRTTVLPKNIKGIAGVSRRYAYDLVDDMTDAYDWALDPASMDRRPDQETPQKGVIIDFERLHDDPEAVNKFTTGIGETGGE